MKHTPGPWNIIGKTHIISQDKKRIGQAFVIDNYHAISFIAKEDVEANANAKLISAAPELLEALQYYFDVLKEARGKEWDTKPDHVLFKMLSAYKKATT